MSALLALVFNPYGRMVVLALAVMAGLYTWKRQAVNSAVAEYVASVELAKVRGERDEALRRQRISEAAQEELDKETARARAYAAVRDKALRDYETNNNIDPDCRVSDDFLDNLDRLQ